MVSMAVRSDSGLYTCEVINHEGVDMASSNVLVKGNILKLACINITLACASVFKLRNV